MAARPSCILCFICVACLSWYIGEAVDDSLVVARDGSIGGAAAVRGQRAVARRHLRTEDNGLSDVVAQVVDETPALTVIGTDAAADTSFYILHTQDTHVLEGYGDVIKTLEGHPSRTGNQSLARFVICVRQKGSLEFLQGLPERSPERPYLVWGFDRSSHEETDVAVLKNRRDVLQVGYDLRPFHTDSAPVALGVTFASPRFFARSFNPDVEPRFFLTFRGSRTTCISCNFFVRPQLKNAFQKSKRRSDILIDVLPPGYIVSETYFAKNITSKIKKFKVPYPDLFDTAYALVLHGQGRWTYRLSEAIGACAIPVIMSDGLTLPFEELIDWNKIAIRLPENHASEHFSKIVDSLPTNRNTIRKMREEACRVNDMFFKTMDKRVDALLRSAAIRSDRWSAILRSRPKLKQPELERAQKK